MSKVRTLQSIAEAGMRQKEFAQKVVMEAPGAFNKDGMKPSLEKGGTVRRDTDNRRKPVVKTTGKERVQQQVPPGAREQGAETEGSKNCQQQKHLGVRKKELPAAKTPQSKGERNRDRREQEDPGTENPGSFPNTGRKSSQQQGRS